MEKGSFVKKAGAVALLLYGLAGAFNNKLFSLLYGADLLIHEVGHPIFGIFGNEFLMFWGGTLMQLIVPLICAGYFLKIGDRYSAGFMFWWHGQNYFHIAPYIKDAREQVLPLLGGGRHDWGYILDKLNVLRYEHLIGNIVWIAGFIIIVAAPVYSLKYANKEV